MDIRLIALDLDRTTLNSQGKLSEGNKNALIKAIEKGIHIVIASGRPFCSLPKDMTEIPGIEYAITSNGAAIYHIPTAKCLHQYKLTKKSVLQILNITQDYPIALETFINGSAYGEASYLDNPSIYGASPQAVIYLQSTRKPVHHMPSFIKKNAANLDSLDIVTNDTHIKQEIWTKLDQISDDIYITSSVARLIEISHKDAGKHSGLQFLQNDLHLTKDQTAAFGDGDNDIDMLHAAGIGIAMANASDACKEASNALTKYYNEDGVAWGMKHILHVID